MHGVLLEYRILRDSAPYYTNMALNGTATQSSTHNHSCDTSASQATDGNSEDAPCSITRTYNESSAWWEVDLKDDKSLVYSVVVYNRIDCCMDRLSNFDVILKDGSQQVLRSLYEAKGGREMMFFPMEPILRGVRYVRIQLRGTNYLSLAEVNVYGKKGLRRARDVA